jgi:hypothetical protein
MRKHKSQAGTWSGWITSGWGVGSEPDDNVPDLVEIRCAGRSLAGRREHVGFGGAPSGGGEGEGGKRAAPHESDRREPLHAVSCDGQTASDYDESL